MFALGGRTDSHPPENCAGARLHTPSELDVSPTRIRRSAEPTRSLRHRVEIDRSPLRRPEHAAQFLGREPPRPVVDHPVTVRTQQHQIRQFRRRLSRNMQRHNMMAFDIARTVRAVHILEIEPAHLAEQSRMNRPELFDLLPAQLPVTLAPEVPHRQQFSLAKIDIRPRRRHPSPPARPPHPPATPAQSTGSSRPPDASTRTRR